jgi:hypothetical protein
MVNHRPENRNFSKPNLGRTPLTGWGATSSAPQSFGEGFDVIWSDAATACPCRNPYTVGERSRIE